MDSINKNQPEDNHENLSSAAAGKKIKELVDKADTCFFNTSPLDSESSGTRPMSIQQADEDGTLWFMSADDSYKNKEIAADATVKLYFKGSQYSDFLYLKGQATISKDREKIRKLWSAPLKAWFTEGENDPRITIIKVVPTEGYYWDSKHGNFVAGVKMLISAAIGKTLDDSIEGELKP